MSGTRSRPLRQEEDDAFPPTVATDDEDEHEERPGRPRTPRADGSTPVRLIGLGVALLGLAAYALLRAVQH
jgi:hypothetical protein